MADAHEALVAQTLVAKIVSGYVRKNRLAPAQPTGADRHRLPIIVGRLRRRLTRGRSESPPSRSADQLRRTTSCTSNVAGAGRRYVAIFEAGMDWPAASIEPDGGCPRNICWRHRPARGAARYQHAVTARQLNEPKINCFDQPGCKIIGRKTALNNSKFDP